MKKMKVHFEYGSYLLDNFRLALKKSSDMYHNICGSLKFLVLYSRTFLAVKTYFSRRIDCTRILTFFFCNELMNTDVVYRFAQTRTYVTGIFKDQELEYSNLITQLRNCACAAVHEWKDFRKNIFEAINYFSSSWPLGVFFTNATVLDFVEDFMLPEQRACMMILRERFRRFVAGVWPFKTQVVLNAGVLWLFESSRIVSSAGSFLRERRLNLLHLYEAEGVFSLENFSFS